MNAHSHWSAPALSPLYATPRCVRKLGHMDREEFRLLAKECLRETTPCDADLDGLFATWDNNGNGKGSVPIKPAIVQMVAAHHALLAKESEMAHHVQQYKVVAIEKQQELSRIQMNKELNEVTR